MSVGYITYKKLDGVYCNILDWLVNSCQYMRKKCAINVSIEKISHTTYRRTKTNIHVQTTSINDNN